ncbi:MAG: matrixin family metalloprotease [Labilithrix sp.]|nr:matrixin family metalloprotease [Labilithrix sp.]
MRARGSAAFRWIGCAAWVVASLSFTDPASAYCRATTCDKRVQDCPIDDNGCPRGGAPLTWRSLPIVYRFHAGGSEKLDMDLARDAVRAAFDEWSGVSCNGKKTSLAFVEGKDIRAMKPASKTAKGREPFGIYFRDDEWPHDDDEDESLALTNQTFGMINGYIDYADIEINTKSRSFAVDDEEEGIDLQAVLTHEVGHYIGLTHSPDRDSIMVARYCASGDRCGRGAKAARALSDDDRAAVCALYPPSGIAGVRYQPAESCAASPAGMMPSNVMIGSIASLFAIALLRLRRRAIRA